MRILFWYAALLFGAGVLTSPLSADEKKAVAKLEGDYTIVSGEEDGKPVPAEHIKGSIVRFTKDEIISTDREKKAVFAAKYILDTSKKPWVINMKSTKPKEGDATGLVKTDGQTVTIVYSLPGVPAPTEFKTKEKGQHLFVLRSLVKGEK
jgi:uncharacterized protein (TIGR03067 family)